MSFFFFSSRRRHTRLQGDWSSDVCSSDLHRWDSFQSLFLRHLAFSAPAASRSIRTLTFGTLSAGNDFADISARILQPAESSCWDRWLVERFWRRTPLRAWQQQRCPSKEGADWAAYLCLLVPQVVAAVGPVGSARLAVRFAPRPMPGRTTEML